jgi:hypothetical protein
VKTASGPDPGSTTPPPKKKKDPEPMKEVHKSKKEDLAAGAKKADEGSRKEVVDKFRIVGRQRQLT